MFSKHFFVNVLLCHLNTDQFFCSIFVINARTRHFSQKNDKNDVKMEFLYAQKLFVQTHTVVFYLHCLLLRPRPLQKALSNGLVSYPSSVCLVFFSNVNAVMINYQCLDAASVHFGPFIETLVATA